MRMVKGGLILGVAVAIALGSAQAASVGVSKRQLQESHVGGEAPDTKSKTVYFLVAIKNLEPGGAVVRRLLAHFDTMAECEKVKANSDFGEGMVVECREVQVQTDD